MLQPNREHPLRYDLDFRNSAATILALGDDLRKSLALAVEPPFYGSVLTGATGTGKSYAMIAARHMVLHRRIDQVGPYGNDLLRDRWRDGLFVSWPLFMADVAEYEDRSKTTRASDWPDFHPTRFLRDFAGPLYLDDVGSERIRWGSEWSIFAELVLQRVLKPELLFVTTNMTPEEIVDKYGERVLSRLQQHCMFIKVAEKDRRYA